MASQAAHGYKPWLFYSIAPVSFFKLMCKITTSLEFTTSFTVNEKNREKTCTNLQSLKFPTRTGHAFETIAQALLLWE